MLRPASSMTVAARAIRGASRAAEAVVSKARRVRGMACAGLTIVVPAKPVPAEAGRGAHIASLAVSRTPAGYGSRLQPLRRQPAIDPGQCRAPGHPIDINEVRSGGWIQCSLNVSFYSLWQIAGAGVLFGAWSLYLRPVKVQVAGVQRDVAVEVFGLGTVEARVTSKIGFKVSGVLVDLRADVGDRVAKGAVLARLDDREQSAQVARAKATVEQTRS